GWRHAALCQSPPSPSPSPSRELRVRCTRLPLIGASVAPEGRRDPAAAPRRPHFPHSPVRNSFPPIPKRRAGRYAKSTRCMPLGTLMTRKLAAEAVGTFWLVFAICLSAITAAGVPGVGIGFAGVALAAGVAIL